MFRGDWACQDPFRCRGGRSPSIYKQPRAELPALPGILPRRQRQAAPPQWYVRAVEQLPKEAGPGGGPWHPGSRAFLRMPAEAQGALPRPSVLLIWCDCALLAPLASWILAVPRPWLGCFSPWNRVSPAPCPELLPSPRLWEWPHL